MPRTTLFSVLICCLAFGAAHAESNTHDSETRLVRSLQAINDNRLDLALNEVDDLLRANPNFKLAQLVKGDLLMARAGALNSFGSVSDAPREAISDLRDEAAVRLQRVLSQKDTTLTPRFLWQLDPQQRYALVVDTSRSTLFVYENVDGVARYITDFYISIGKLGAEKTVRGDLRTPIGVYFVQSRLEKRNLADLYGNGAYPLDYPNVWDRKNRRTGSGIWLHGTPSDTYSRPPRASQGCVVLANDDLDRLAPYLQIGITPVIIVNQMVWSSDDDLHDRDNLLQAIEQWRTDWSNLDTAAYLKHYAADFSNGSTDYSAWAKQKQLVNSAKTWAKVGLSKVSIFTYPDQPDMVVVSFEQDYSSSNLSNRMKKRQYWIKQENKWKIIYEGAA